MELFVKTVTDWKPLTISAKSSVLDVRLGLNASVVHQMEYNILGATCQIEIVTFVCFHSIYEYFTKIF